MLTGRESLVRLIGKRRRFLPNRQSLLAAPVQSSLNLCVDIDGRICLEKSVEEPLVAEFNQFKPVVDKPVITTSYVNEVACPVCGTKITGGDYVINTHLDACLSRGTKRKLTQRTLLQLNFSPISKVQSGDSVKSNTVLVHRDSDYSSLRSALFMFPAEKENAKNEPGLSEELDSNHNISCLISSSSKHFKNEMNIQKVTESTANILEETLETFIVGRRYADQKEIHPGATISLLRDPHNARDPNAIQVVSAESNCCESLGFLPRELAQYLSSLIDKYGLRFEGHVTSIPKHSYGVTPIQIVCQKTLDWENNYKDDEVFKCLWENVLHAVESARNHPPSAKYQLNFCLILEEVLRNNVHLLTEDETNLMESFMTLSDDCQRLFIRLYTRKGPWFRMSTLSYSEIMDAYKAAKQLAEKGYICFIEDAKQLCENDINDLLNILTVSELHEIWSMLKKGCGHGMRKQDLIASLLSAYADGTWTHLSNMIFCRSGSCIRISLKAEFLIWRAERLFFLNGEQDLSTFLLSDMEKVKYPTYNCMILEPIFSNRGDLLSYEEAIEVAQIMDEALDVSNTELVLRCIRIAESHLSPPLPLQYLESVIALRYLFSASWVYSKVVTLGISFLEQERRYSDANNLLKQLLNTFTCDLRRGYWILRLSINLEHLGYTEESLQVAENGLLDSWVRAGSRMAMQRRVLRLGKPPRRWKVPSFSKSVLRTIPEVLVQGRPLNSGLGEKNRFYNEEGEQCGVEQLALHYYAGEGGGWRGVHTESGIWLTIFGLLMWDVMFADVPNVFYTRFQNGPLDLGTEGFYTMRKSIIECHLQQIHDGMAEEVLIKSWETHHATACRGINWDRHSLDELRAAVTCVGGPCLASLCRLLAQDYQSWSSGMPDLLLWRFHGQYSGEAKLVEVKGPRDRLSEQQRAWLLLLMDCGFLIEVCKVGPKPRST